MNDEELDKFQKDLLEDFKMAVKSQESAKFAVERLGYSSEAKRKEEHRLNSSISAKAHIVTALIAVEREKRERIYAPKILDKKIK